MQYKTIVLELIRQRPEYHRQLREKRLLPRKLDVLAGQLKDSHEEWQDRLSSLQPSRDSQEIKAQALELALKELKEGLPPTSSEDEGSLSLDAAIAYVRRHTPPA